VKRGKVIHTPFGHESILRIVEDRYRLRPLTVRDAKANSIAAAFDFTRARAARAAGAADPAVDRLAAVRGGERPALLSVSGRTPLAGRPTSRLHAGGRNGNERRPG
jgi:hypothetical protein